MRVRTGAGAGRDRIDVGDGTLAAVRSRLGSAVAQRGAKRGSYARPDDDEGTAMFLQLIFAPAADPEGLRRQFERWHDELAAGAPGWQGSTVGVTGDGRFAAVIRFESAETARVNSDRPEQGDWWRAVERHLDGPAEFVDAADVTVAHEDDPGAAGFVQVMRARVADRRRFEEVEKRFSPTFLELRPDVLAAYRAWPANDRVIAVDYFRSEAEARAGESTEMPEELQAGFAEWMGLLSDHEWFDLTDPWVRMP